MIKKDSVMYDDFMVLDESDDPVTGLTTFTKILYDPDKSEVSGSITVTIEELGDGLYRASFTPNKLGSWTLIIYNEDYFPWGKGNTYKCVKNLLDDIPGATWDELLADHNIYNTFGEKNQLGVPSEDVDDYKADVSALSLETTAQAIKAKTDKLKDSWNDPTSEEIADDVWDEDIADHTDVDTFGAKNQKVVPSENVNDYKSSGFSTPTDVTDAQDNINDNIDANEDKIDNILTSLNLRALETTAQAIKAKTDKLLFDIDNYVRSHIMASDIDISITEADMDQIVDKTWDEQTTDHEISGSTGAALTDNIPVSQSAIINKDTLDSGALALGIVVDNEGVPVGNARVGAWNLEAGENGLIQFETYTEADGTFTLKVLKGDTYYVSVLEPYYGWKNREVIVP